MSVQEFDNRLSDRLAVWFAHDGNARMEAVRALLDVGEIDFSGSVLEQWGSVVEYARRHGRTVALMQQALADFGPKDDQGGEFAAWIVEEEGRVKGNPFLSERGDAVAEHGFEGHEGFAASTRLIRIEAKVESLVDMMSRLEVTAQKPPLLLRWAAIINSALALVLVLAVIIWILTTHY